MACLFIGLRSAHARDAGDVESRARTHYSAGKALYGLGNYSDALRELLAGYSLLPKRQFLVNLGQCYRRLDELGKARDVFARYLEQSPPDDPDRPAVEELIRQVDRQMSQAAASPPVAQPTAAPMTLTKAAPESLPPPKRKSRPWWLIPVGAVAAAGLGVGLYFALRPSCGGSLGCVSLGGHE